MTILFVVGMEQEAEAVRKAFPGALIVIGAGDTALLSSRLMAALDQNAATIDRVLSVGICGALNPALRPGDVVVGVSAAYQLSEISCDLQGSDALFDALQTSPQIYRVGWGRLAWSASAVSRMVDKAALRKATMCDVVDEETFIAGSIAVARGIRWGAVRVVCDPATLDLSNAPAALVKLTSEGRDNMGAILESVIGNLGQVPELIQLAGYSKTAFASLEAALARIGSTLA